VHRYSSGEHIGQRIAGTADVLTPQEAQIARLVSDGYRNRDIASTCTVTQHGAPPAAPHRAADRPFAGGPRSSAELFVALKALRTLPMPAGDYA